MATKVVINRKALQEFFVTDPGAQAGLAKTAKAVEVAVAEAGPFGSSLSWPWRRPIKHGWFKKSLHTRPFRGGFRVYSRDPFAHLIEFGSIKNPTYAPFRRVIRAFNGRINAKKAASSGEGAE
jgi:hypothetical protein